MREAVPYLLTALALFLASSAWAGYVHRWMALFGTLLVGLGLNQLWMMLALNAQVLEIHALIAQASLLGYGLTAAGAGFLVNRFARHLRASAVDREPAKD